jgi:hypothetical protein
MFKQNLLSKLASFVTIVSIVLGASIVHVELAFAAALNTLSDTQSSVKASALSDHTIQFVTPSGITAGQARCFKYRLCNKYISNVFWIY